ncbi:protein translocase subunit SecD, partial [Streptomyces eurythermus]
MAAPKRGRSASAPSKPGRSLALILIAIVALAGGMFASGHTTPRLGIDLAGGTSITLKAKADQGSAINKANMDTAVDIMNRRVNGLGVSEAEVQTQGNDNIIVNIPKGTNSKEAQEQVGTTAKLYFRPVLASEPSGPAPKSPSPSASSKGGSSPKPGSSPSASASAGEKATGSGKETASGSASPSASATSQGRAVTDALKADATPSPSGSASGSAKPSGTPSAPAGNGSGADAKLQAQYAALDCTKPTDRANAGKNAKPGEPTVACGKIDDSWYKYLLGPA